MMNQFTMSPDICGDCGKELGQQLHRLIEDLEQSFNESKEAELKRQLLNLCKVHPAPIAAKDLWILEIEANVSVNEGKLSLRQMVELKHVDDKRKPSVTP